MTFDTILTDTPASLATSRSVDLVSEYPTNPINRERESCRAIEAVNKSLIHVKPVVASSLNQSKDKLNQVLVT